MIIHSSCAASLPLGVTVPAPPTSTAPPGRAAAARGGAVLSGSGYAEYAPPKP